ncbi:hemin receptor [Acidobacteria bacterium Mor1]|nr:hemin receptor [Acidobacteria bacterium Mor1]
MCAPYAPKQRGHDMTEQQKQAVRESWSQVVPIADKAAELFYTRLFQLDPSLRHLFKGDMAEQGRKLTMTLNLAVKSLDRLDQLTPVLQDLGRRHVGYGVKDSHYAAVGAALLWTLEQGLGEAFTGEVHDAWAATYGLVSGVMMDAAAAAA